MGSFRSNRNPCLGWGGLTKHSALFSYNVMTHSSVAVAAEDIARPNAGAVSHASATLGHNLADQDGKDEDGEDSDSVHDECLEIRVY